ncbi:hypothetical protein MSAR_15260 [Mycolicibacterium sarraceniae]|uniref:Uncharacterized protein n=1 Tax=Mycolicibacterium sarraceniae TaxID=1534348 RepID=A0A7I7SPD8_9MYCO|nr:hypothetical protein MSAR_15260 [Mycolicibacterium sarraceniae]
MCGPVEIARTQALQHVGDRILGQQHPAQHRLLRGKILRRLATEVLGRRRTAHPGLTEIVNDRHRFVPTSV